MWAWQWWSIGTISRISHCNPVLAFRFSSVSATHPCLNFVVIYPSVSHSCGTSSEINVSPGIDLKVSNLPCLTVWASKTKQWLFHLNSWSSLPSLNSWGLSLCLETMQRREENGLALMETETAQPIEWGLLNMSIIPSPILETLSLGRKEVTMLHSLLTGTSVGNMMARESPL